MVEHSVCSLTRYIAVDQNYCISVHDIVTGALQYHISGLRGTRYVPRLYITPTVSSSGALFACTRVDPTIVGTLEVAIVQMDSGECVSSVLNDAAMYGPLVTYALSHDDRVLAIGGITSICSYNIRSGKRLATLMPHARVWSSTCVIAYAPDDSIIAYLGPNVNLYLLDPQTLTVIHKYTVLMLVESKYTAIRMVWHGLHIVAAEMHATGGKIQAVVYDPVDLVDATRYIDDWCPLRIALPF
jgi:hypothetical protein